MPVIDSSSNAKFDALVRINKAESLMSFIMATYNANTKANKKEEVAKRLKSSYELFREDVKGTNSGAGSYGQGERNVMEQFESHYTMGYEMGIWEDSNFSLTPLAVEVAKYNITIREYIGRVFLNLFTYYTVNGEDKYHHFLYEVLKTAKVEGVINGIIHKNIISESLPEFDKKNEQTNLIFNYLVATEFFDKVDKENMRLSRAWSGKGELLIEKCNLEFLSKSKDDAFSMARDKKQYARYVTKVELEDADSTGSEDSKSETIVDGGTNVLLYGVPGSGKSWTIEHEYCKKETNVERLVFHPDYTYSDFIGQILPNVSDDGQVSYKFTAGPFTNILAEAHKRPYEEFILIIEEINRGNAPAIFGEVFQLLDRKTEIRDVDDDGYPIGTSEYGITNANIARIVYGDAKHKVRIPSNLSIIGTMNTSDQNVFTLDTAFQRRWEMRLIENNFEHVDRRLADAKILDTDITWEVFCTQINKIIVGNNARMTSAEDKRLGAYFIHLKDLEYNPNMGDLSNGEYDTLRKKEQDKTINDAEKDRLSEIRAAMKQNRKFPEKVIKYLWDDAFKFNREIVFETTTYQSLEQVIRTFMYAEKLDRLAMFKDNVRNAFTNPEQ